MRLHDLYQTLTPEQRAGLAEKAGVSTGYLWQIATRWKRADERRRAPATPSVGLISRLASADERLSVADMLSEFHAVTITAPSVKRRAAKVAAA